jgi:hypothetical protein
MDLEWIVSRSFQGRDLDWNPVTIVVGYVRVDNGVRWAVLVGDQVAVTTPGTDRLFSSHVVDLVDAREGEP